eukprot:359504-Chlamydomonas_euryale.AAC.7
MPALLPSRCRTLNAMPVAARASQLSCCLDRRSAIVIAPDTAAQWRHNGMKRPHSAAAVRDSCIGMALRRAAQQRRCSLIRLRSGGTTA